MTRVLRGTIIVRTQVRLRGGRSRDLSLGRAHVRTVVSNFQEPRLDEGDECRAAVRGIDATEAGDLFGGQAQSWHFEILGADAIVQRVTRHVGAPVVVVGVLAKWMSLQD